MGAKYTILAYASQKDAKRDKHFARPLLCNSQNATRDEVLHAQDETNKLGGSECTLMLLCSIY